MTKYELAERYGMTHHTITHWRRRGLLPHVRAGYRTIVYPVCECDQALNRLVLRPRWLR